VADISYKEPDAGEIRGVPRWYWTKRIRSFGDLISHQSRWHGIALSMGTSGEFNKMVWSPFLRKDFPRIFQEVSTSKFGKVRDSFVTRLNKVTLTFAQVFGVTEEENRRRLKALGKPQKDIERSLKVQNDILKKMNQEG
jgi:hypothetical protein